jgi:hypothetical protein
MAQHIEQDDPVGTTVARRSTGAWQPPTSAANDNDCEGPWPLVPFPEGLHLCEGVGTPQPVRERFTSWRAPLSRLAYAAAVLIAMFGWLYLLSLALVSSVQKILS